jgi:hypothetical protein
MKKLLLLLVILSACSTYNEPIQQEVKPDISYQEQVEQYRTGE